MAEKGWKHKSVNHSILKDLPLFFHVLNAIHLNSFLFGSEKMKAGSVRGSKSNVDWKGRKVIMNGKTVGAGEGTFSFGNKPTV
ncbi:unnamed protein product [Caenorhabditis nigoni]